MCVYSLRARPVYIQAVYATIDSDIYTRILLITETKCMKKMMESIFIARRV